MKKVYQKPSMIEEKFALAQSIAAGCTILGQGWGDPTISNGVVCTWDDGINIYFSNDNCDSPVADRVCYNAPMDGLVFFSS